MKLLSILSKPFFSKVILIQLSIALILAFAFLFRTPTHQQNAQESPDTSAGGENDPNSCVSYQNYGNTFSCKNLCIAGVETNMGNSGVYSCASATYCCRNDELYQKNYSSRTSPQTTFSGVGYCADGGRKSPVIVGGATCSLANETTHDSSGDSHCQSLPTASTAPYFYRCLGDGTDPDTSPDPGSGSPATRQGPADGPCALEKGGIDTSKGSKGYDDAFCNKKRFNAGDAAQKDYCGGVYTDAYFCLDGSTDHVERTFTEATNPCNRNPWCPADPTPATGNIGIGQTCTTDTDCKEYSIGARCRDFDIPKNIKTCQWPGGVAPTATPGAPGKEDCDTLRAKGQATAGCACPQGGGCAPGLACYRSADLKTSSTNPNSYFCSPVGTLWCHKSKTAAANEAACLGSTTYVSPTPTPKDLGYQADCPDNGLNKCDTSCTGGYVRNTTRGPGGTTGDQVCSEYKSTGTSSTGWLCCTQNTSTGSSGSSSTGNTGNMGNTVSPAPASSTCANNATEQCQAGIDGNTNETCVTGWSNVGKRNCTLNTTCCKKN